MPNIYNKKNAARALNISTETIDRYRRAGKLPFHQIGDRIVFTESDLTTFLENCAVPATSPTTAREKSAIEKIAGGVA